MNNILEILKNRRVWIVIIGAVLAIMNLFGKQFDIDTNMVADKIVDVVNATGTIIVSGLAAWSYLFPKKTNL